MKLTSSMNTSALFVSTSENVEITLGWGAMPSFPAQTEEEMVLGWDALPAFGEAVKAPASAEVVAEFVRSTTRTDKADLLNSFWSTMSLRA